MRCAKKGSMTKATLIYNRASARPLILLPVFNKARLNRKKGVDSVPGAA